MAQDDDDVVRVNTELVVLNVSVTDKTGQYVKNLKKTDFKIYEDGVEVQSNNIASFSAGSPYAAVVLIAVLEAWKRDSLSHDQRRSDSLMDFVRKMWQLFTSLIRRWNVCRTFPVARSCTDGLCDSCEGHDDAERCDRQAAKTLADRPEHRKAIVILSDGIDTYSNASSEKALESALAVGATIFAVDMASLEIAGSARRQSAMSLQGFAEDWGKIYLDARWTSVARCFHRNRERAWSAVHDFISSDESEARWEVAYASK